MRRCAWLFERNRPWPIACFATLSKGLFLLKKSTRTIIVPKQHFASLDDGVPADLLGQLMARVPEIAKIKGIDESGYRVVVNTGADAGQTVFHLHIHILGGKNLGEHVL